MISGMRFDPSSFRHFPCADIMRLNAMASPVLRLIHPFALTIRWRTVAKVAACRISCRWPLAVACTDLGIAFSTLPTRAITRTGGVHTLAVEPEALPELPESHLQKYP